MQKKIKEQECLLTKEKINDDQKYSTSVEMY